MIDTHSHLYSEEFDADRDEMIARAQAAGVEHIILPNVDIYSLPRMAELKSQYPGYCHAAIGLHPTYVKEDYASQLITVRAELQFGNYVALGEVGIDLYWDKTYYPQQVKAFQQQVQWSLDFDLPLIIHVRNSFRETMEALEPFKDKGLRGVFHSFIGTVEEANEILAFGGFKLGINGIVTFKNSGLAEVLKHIDLKHILLETDAPYLTPTPYRGKRNESAYVSLICEKLVDVYKLTPQEIDAITTQNALEVFDRINS
jgi:TatD DNase family protein